MNIGFDARKYYDFGIGTYIQNLIKEFDKNTDFKFYYFINSKDISELRSKHKGEFIVNDSGKYSFTELFSFKEKVKKLKIDLFHSPHYTLPFLLDCKKITTIHDIIPLRFPNYFSFPKRKYAELMIKHCYKNSELILVNSDFTKNDLIDYFKFKDNKIIVTKLGFDENYEVANIDLKDRFGINKEFILYVGSLKPHKNIPFLISGYSKLKNKSNYQFVFSGEGLAENPELKSKLVNEKIDYVFTGKLIKSELNAIYKSAKVLVFPSLYEGFGLPILEAMKFGVPVIASNSTSIPEVSGDAALLFKNNDLDDLTNKIETLLADVNMQKELIRKGKQNIKKYSFQKCAIETIDCYNKILK